ncbi:MAG TPA: hypothetical protein VI385_11095 [Flavisolibacter sp.]|jgi:hypothetical protein
MDESKISLIIAVIALLTSIYTLVVKSKPQVQKTADDNFLTKPLRLQAYERLVLLAERIALPNLISRISQPGLSAREMQFLLLESIKQEYEYNASQQIYVSETAWNAVRSLRDQTLLMINSIAKSLPAEASASELNRQLMEAMMHEEKAAVHTYATNTLNAEAKKIM